MKLPEALHRLAHLPGPLPRPGRTSRLDTWDTLDASEQPIADLLRRHADRLSPRRESLSRVRSETLSAVAAAAAFVPATGRVAAGRTAGYIHPRLLAAAAGIVLLAVGGVGFAATQTGPGQPFYQWRLDIEALGLPPSGSTARVDADLDRAQQRLNEIASAAASQNWNAAADAALAYTSVVAAMGRPQDAAGLATYRQVLSTQLASLESLRTEASGPATAALDTAIARVQALLADAGATPTDKGNSGGGADKSPKPTPSEVASPTDKDKGGGADKSPKPTPSEVASPTPKHTPKPKAS